jgi:integrase
LIKPMPKPRPPHLNRHVTRHGTVVWYVRLGRGPRVRLRAPYNSAAFWAEYRAAVAGDTAGVVGNKPGAGTLTWLWDQYRRKAPDWAALKPATRRQRENLMKGVLAASGNAPFTSINKKSLIAGRDARAATPNRARHFCDNMRRLFRWAHEQNHVSRDPAADLKNPTTKKTEGFKAWTEADVEAYCKRWPIGTRQRVWLDVLLYTGLRRGDAVQIGRQHVRNGVATLRTEKSGETVTVTLPILPVLQRTLDAGPIGELAWICGERGAPLVKEAFGNMFAEAARAAGVKKSAHGVRKIAAITAALNGATVKQLEALFGWRGGRMAELYTEAADRVRLARESAHMMDGKRTALPTPQA